MDGRVTRRTGNSVTVIRSVDTCNECVAYCRVVKISKTVRRKPGASVSRVK